MANARLNFPPLLWVAVALLLPADARASGGFDDEPPPALPYYLDRLPAKPPALIFEETFNGPTAPAKPVDFQAALLSLAKDCDAGQAPADLLAKTEALLVQARLDPIQPAALCNVCNDVHDLFAATPAVTGKVGADYIRWRVAHAAWFHLSWQGKRPASFADVDDEPAEQQRAEAIKTLAKLAADPAAGPLRVHWLCLRGACEFPRGGADCFRQVVDGYPDHPRAEIARFMLARCVLAASRAHGDGYTELTAEQKAAAASERAEARRLFEDYQKRYPQGRFAADVPGWLGASAFGDGDYLGALDDYLQQADVPGHPEVLKSAGFMCERCLSHLATAGDQEALRRVAAHPRLAMSLIYLLINTPEADNYDGKSDEPAQVSRWRRALLPRLAAEVAAHQNAYASTDWQPRYLAILAQAASGEGDQTKALALCEVAKDGIAHSDDLAFIRLVALGRAHRLKDAIAAGREFARLFPQSPLAPGAALRLALALQDDHQAGAAVGELYGLERVLAARDEKARQAGEEAYSDLNSWESVYPSAEADLSVSRSVLQRDTDGAEAAQLAQITDALLNFAPLPELAAGVAGLDPADAANLRAVLVQRWLGEEENFAEAKRYATAAQWSAAAAGLEKLAAAATSAPAGEARAAARLQLADAWVAARGQLLFAPLETDKTRHDLFASDAERADLRRRDNGQALGLPPAQINHALACRDEWQHAFDWYLQAADAAPAGSPTEARALWAALRLMPSVALVSPFTFLRAGETDASGLSRQIYERLRRECPASREAREFAVYYDLSPPTQPNADDGTKTEPDLGAAMPQVSGLYGQREYRTDPGDSEDTSDSPALAIAALRNEAVALRSPEHTRDPARLGREVAALQARLATMRLQRDDLLWANFLDDLAAFLQEPAAKLTPAAIGLYVELRVECLSVENWGWRSEDSLPPVPGASEGQVDDTVLAHIRAAYREKEMAPFKDYLDFLVLAVIANHNIDVPVPGESQDAKEGEEGQREPATYKTRDYPKLARLAEGFLRDYPHSRKREAASLLYARALYDASRPTLREKFAVWPESEHFAGRTIVTTQRQQPFEPKKIGAALNAYDHEFPQGKYAGEIRNLRGLLAWRTQDWPLALDLTLQTLANADDPNLQGEAGRRLLNIFVDGLTDETERTRCLAAIKARPIALDKLRDFLPKSDYPLQALRSWILAQL